MSVDSICCLNCFSNDSIQQSPITRITKIVLTVLMMIAAVVTILGFLSHMPSYSSWIGLTALVFFSITMTVMCCRQEKEKNYPREPIEFPYKGTSPFNKTPIQFQTATPSFGIANQDQNAFLAQTEKSLGVANQMASSSQYLSQSLEPDQTKSSLITFDLPDHEGKTAFHWVVILGNLNAVETLQKAKANPYLKDKAGNTPYFYCLKQNRSFESAFLKGHFFHWQIQSNRSFKSLNIEKENDISLQFSTEGGGLLALASFFNECEVIKELIQLGVSPNVQGEDGRTPLHFAMIQGNKEAIELLIKEGAKPLSDKTGKTPIDSASGIGLKILFACLLNMDRANLKQNYDLNKLLYLTTIIPDSIEFAKRLIEEGADINSRHGEHQFTPIHMAAMVDHGKLISALKPDKKTLELRSKEEMTALVLAESQEHINAFKALFDLGADPNVTFLKTPLIHSSCRRGNPAIVSLLLNSEVLDLKALDFYGRPFFWLIEVGQRKWIDIIEDLSEKTKLTILNEFDVVSCLESDDANLIIPQIHPFLMALAASIPRLEKIIVKSLNSIHQANLAWIVLTWERLHKPDYLFTLLSASPAFFIEAFYYLNSSNQKRFVETYKELFLNEISEFFPANIEEELLKFGEEEKRKSLLKMRARVECLILLCENYAQANLGKVLGEEFNETVTAHRYSLSYSLSQIVSLLRSGYQASLEQDSFFYFYELGLRQDSDYQRLLGISKDKVHQLGLSKIKDITLLDLSTSFSVLIQKARAAIESKKTQDIEKALSIILEWQSQKILSLKKLEEFFNEKYKETKVLSPFIQKLQQCEHIFRKMQHDEVALNDFLKDLLLWDKARILSCLKVYLNQPNLEKALNGLSLSDYASNKNEDITFYYHLKHLNQ